MQRETTDRWRQVSRMNGEERSFSGSNESRHGFVLCKILAERKDLERGVSDNYYLLVWIGMLSRCPAAQIMKQWRDLSKREQVHPRMNNADH
jgi:hypothetical protein